MDELFFAFKEEIKFDKSVNRIVKFVVDRTGAAVCLSEGWRVYKLPAQEIFKPEINFDQPEKDDAIPELKPKRTRKRVQAEE